MSIKDLKLKYLDNRSMNEYEDDLYRAFDVTTEQTALNEECNSMIEKTRRSVAGCSFVQVTEWRYKHDPNCSCGRHIDIIFSQGI